VPRGGELLEELGRLVKEHGLIGELGVEVDLFRVRLDGADGPYERAKALGAPPKTRARQSRMSPAGIPMLYLGDDVETAVAETLAADPDPPDGLTVGRFGLVEPVLVVDLTALAPVPSILVDAPETTSLRRRLGFLHGFRADVGGLVEHDGREHIDYVPTQVVSEYLRHRFRTSDGRPVHRLAWESTRRPGGTSRVLFVGPAQCVEVHERPAFVEGPLVELRGHERRTASKAE
jgi:hypothetical protein